MSEVQEITVAPTVREEEGLRKYASLVVGLHNYGQKDFYVTINGTEVELRGGPGIGDGLDINVRAVYIGPRYE